MPNAQQVQHCDSFILSNRSTHSPQSFIYTSTTSGFPCANMHYPKKLQYSANLQLKLLILSAVFSLLPQQNSRAGSRAMAIDSDTSYAPRMHFWGVAFHRLIESVAGTSRDAQQNMLPKVAVIRAGCQDHVQSGFEYLRGWIIHKLPEQPAPTFAHTHRKKLFSLEVEFPVFQSVSITCSPCTRCH